ncbi:hypothetical protein [Streptomyces sp. MUSC 14]|uniref:hypothetical protein n=1 Tax=Streptomyces sp. MUSC 14 TaxID=1354889 RepID=UPI0015A6824C|nr:hypothetical protein [Streptomyces sp. MUSC 14]
MGGCRADGADATCITIGDVTPGSLAAARLGHLLPEALAERPPATDGTVLLTR